MGKGVSLILIYFLWLTTVPEVISFCDPRLPHCRNQPHKDVRGNNCKPFWLIPGRTDDCTKPTSTKTLAIDPNSVSISPSPVKLPGCFTISMNVDVTGVEPTSSYLSKVEYNWWNFPQFSGLPCQNTSADGCGGYGNNCYYCDICHNLKRVDETGSSAIGQQFKNIDCPSRTGPYTLKREFCFNDFSELDKDHNCVVDALESDQSNGVGYKGAMKSIQQIGYGTVTAKFTLARNATADQRTRKFGKEADIEKQVEMEMTKKREENGWAVNDSQYITFRDWYIKAMKDKWHKNNYLPWLLYTNEIGCLLVNFQVCDKQPTRISPSSIALQCV